MTFPFFSLRGAHPRTMLDDICDTLAALRTAAEKLEAISPNARDYATASEFAAAVREHSARIDAVRGVIRELEVLAEVWAAEGDKRVSV